MVGGSVKANTRPTVTVNGSNRYVYFVNASGEIANWTFSGGKWIGPTAFGGEVATGTSPTSFLDPANNYQYAYYLQPNGNMGNWTWSGSWIGPNEL